MSAPIKVVVHGALGKVGREVVSAACQDPGLEPVGAVDARASADALPLPVGTGSIPLSRDLEAILKKTSPGVIVDFTVAEASLEMIRVAAKTEGKSSLTLRAAARRRSNPPSSFST